MFDKNLELPEGWKMVTMNDVCTKIGDIDHKMPKSLTNGIPYVSTKDFTDNLKITFDKAKFISEEDYQNLSRKIKPEKGDIIFPRYGTIGKNILVDFDRKFLVSYSCAIVKPNHNLVTSKYLYLYSLSPKITDEIRKYVVETTQANIGIASIKKFVFPLPPLSEQQEIVAKIEELLSELDKGKEQLETARQQLKVYRQAVLKWAFEGKGKSSNIGNLFDFSGGGTPSKKESSYWGGKIPWASVKDVKGDYLFDTQDRISEEGLSNSASNIAKPNDVILITRISPGKTIITKIQTAINQDLKVVQPKFSTTPNFIHYLFKSIEREVVRRSSGTTVLGVNLNSLKEIPIPFIELEEQNKVVQEIESRLSVCDKVEETITQSLQQAETLRQSILKQAFEGKLVKKLELTPVH